jgi:hypothetical protein
MSINRGGAIAALACGAVLAFMAAANAASALAAGPCGAFGYGLDFTHVPDADAAALAKCGARCQVVGRTRKGCAALAVDVKNVCGPHGWATAPRLGQAQNAALRKCYGFGGKACVIRAFLCDAKG